MFLVGANFGLLAGFMKRRWRKFRYRLEWLGLVLLTNLVPLVPRRVVVLFVQVFGRIVYACDTRGRTVALANITAAFGDRYTPAQRNQMARASFCNFGRTMCDLFWAKALTPKNFRRYLHIENAAVLHRLHARGESVVLICAHHGNFEWGGLAAGFEGVPAMIVTETFKNAQLSAFFQRCRQVSGHRIIPQESSMIKLLKHVRRGGVAGVLVDLNLHPDKAATIIEAFGMKMCVTYLHAVLAERGPARLVPVESISQPDGTCRVTFHEPLALPPGATHQQVAQHCWDFFAPKIQADPQLWLWMYKHWRFKPQDAVRPYPFYAQVCPEFDALLAKVTARPAPGPRQDPAA